MSKEIYISTTPHETRLAIVEDEQLAEIYYERENEYTLAGSIYNGKVTRVLPGMQSSFVDIGLERDAFLYVTDFMEEQGDAADFDNEGGGSRRASSATPREERRRDASRRDEGGREASRGARDRGSRRGRRESPADPAEATDSFEEPIAPAPVEDPATTYDNEAALDGQGSRRWRGRRGRRRGRGGREGSFNAEVVNGTYAEQVEPELLGSAGETIVIEGASSDFAEDGTELDESGTITIDLSAAAPAEEPENLGRRNVHRPGREGRPAREERQDRDGRGDRGRRSRESRPEFVADEPVASTPAALVLPGESIRKYRSSEELQADEATQPVSGKKAEAAAAPTKPSFEIVGWDGGLTLPGESLSRHRNAPPKTAPAKPEMAASPATQAAPPPAAAPDLTAAAESAAEHVAPSPIPDQEEIAPALVPEETGGLTQHPAHADESAAVSPHAPDVAAIVASAEEEVSAPSAGEYQPAEYEPVEGEGASFGDTNRTNLRRLKQRAEPAAPDAEASGKAEAETFQPETFTSEREQEPVYEAAIAAESATDLDTSGAGQTASPALEQHEQAEPGTSAIEPHEITSVQPDGEMFSTDPDLDGEHYGQDGHPQDAELPSQEGLLPPQQGELSVEGVEAHSISEIHAYGEGDLEEEEVDGDEYEYEVAVAATDEDDFEDYEEETLEGTADLGAMLQEISMDERTLPAPDEDEDEDEFQADSAAGGFTVDDFGGEPQDAPEGEAGGEESTGTERRGRRDTRRGRDRGQRGERPFRGGAGADRGRGRSRQSVQTMDLPAITDLLKPGQEVLVQIAKEPIAKKGARITSHIALPGRFLVFMPTVNHTGVSRKISSDEERRRLKSILLSEKGEAQGGFIVRTAAEGASEEELRNDLRFLIQLWQDIKTRSESSKSPALIYHDLGLIERILRDQVTDSFSAIWVDSEQEYERVLRFLQRFQPSLVRRVKLYTKEAPLFEHFGITTEIDKALKSKVWLKSGGSIVINQTEALVAIDINTGKYVGKTARLEDTILKTNLDAIPEIVRQIRLRDLGGIIVIDFIDMDERKNRAKVMQALEDELKTDRAPSKVLPFNDFGLVIMTRKRVKQSLERTLCIPDPITEGTGMIKSPITVANEIYIEMRKMHRHIEKGDVMLRVHPEVVKQLKSNGARRLQELEEMTHKTILLKSDATLSPEQFDIH